MVHISPFTVSELLWVVGMFFVTSDQGWRGYLVLQSIMLNSLKAYSICAARSKSIFQHVFFFFCLAYVFSHSSLNLCSWFCSICWFYFTTTGCLFVCVIVFPNLTNDHFSYQVRILAQWNYFNRTPPVCFSTFQSIWVYIQIHFSKNAPFL